MPLTSKVEMVLGHFFKRLRKIPKRMSNKRRQLYQSLKALRFRRSRRQLSKVESVFLRTSRPARPRVFYQRRPLAMGLVATNFPLLTAYQRQFTLGKRMLFKFFGEFRDIFAQRYFNKFSTLMLTYKLFEEEFEGLEEATFYDWFVGNDFMTGEDFCIYTNEGDKVLRSFRPSLSASSRAHEVFVYAESRKPRLGVFLSNLTGAAGYGQRARRWVSFQKHRRALRLAGLLSDGGTF